MAGPLSQAPLKKSWTNSLQIGEGAIKLIILLGFFPCQDGPKQTLEISSDRRDSPQTKPNIRPLKISARISPKNLEACLKLLPCPKRERAGRGQGAQKGTYPLRYVPFWECRRPPTVKPLSVAQTAAGAAARRPPGGLRNASNLGANCPLSGSAAAAARHGELIFAGSTPCFRDALCR